MAELVDVSIFSDYLSLGGLGFVTGVIIPLGFRIVGYLVDSVFLFTR